MGSFKKQAFKSVADAVDFFDGQWPDEFTFSDGSGFKVECNGPAGFIACSHENGPDVFICSRSQFEQEVTDRKHSRDQNPAGAIPGTPVRAWYTPHHCPHAPRPAHYTAPADDGSGWFDGLFYRSREDDLIVLWTEGPAAGYFSVFDQKKERYIQGCSALERYIRPRQ